MNASAEGPIFLKRTCPTCGTKFPADHNICPECRTHYERTRGLGKYALEPLHAFALEDATLDKGAWGGALLILIAVVWFVAGWLAGMIFFYPVVLALIGICGVVVSLRPRKPRPGRARRRGPRSGARGRD